MKQQTPFFITITSEVLRDRDLSPIEKLIFTEIMALTYSCGYCYASNSHFADIFDRAIETISRNISKLQSKGYIYTEININDGNSRKIYVKYTGQPFPQKHQDPLDENVNTSCQKHQNPIDENVKHSNTLSKSFSKSISKDTASGLSQNENPTVKDSLIVQKPDRDKLSRTEKPKKEDDFEQFWLFWKDLCKNKGSQTGEKKPAKIQYEKVLKKVKQDDIMRVLKAFNDYIQIAFENNKNCERWIKSANWDNIDEAVADYKQQENNRKKELIKDGKPLPLPQKTTMEAEKEVIDTNALIELRNAKYNALTQDRQKASDEIRDHLLTYFGELHREWINSSLWFQQNLENDEINLHIRIFSEAKRKVIELNAEKIRNKFPLLKGNTVNQIIIKVIK